MASAFFLIINKSSLCSELRNIQSQQSLLEHSVRAQSSLDEALSSSARQVYVVNQPKAIFTILDQDERSTFTSDLFCNIGHLVALLAMIISFGVVSGQVRTLTAKLNNNKSKEDDP
ncbi:hypothetical protein OAB00_04575 [Akkermansiaceae bacterium]|nr:hypothetical protein [Akkermansiaceae bacterium]